MTISEETKLLLTTIHHQKAVQALLRSLAYKLLERADLHDLSKLTEAEFAGFLTMGNKPPFGTPEYEQALEAGKETIALHHRQNRHHPEHWPNGASGMRFIDFAEMVCDQVAANRAAGERSFEENMPERRKRYGLTPEQEFLTRFIAEELNAP